MDSKRRYILLVFLLTFVEIWNLISSADISFKKYYIDPSLVGYRCGQTETPFEVNNVFDLLRCGRLCYVDNMCQSIFYQPDSYTCIKCRDNFGITTCKNQTYPGSMHFRSNPTYGTYTSDSDCKDIVENQCSAPSGLHEIRLWKSKKILTVFCDMDTDGGGWTVFQNRFDGSVNFTRNFFDYDNGFGNINGEFWLGLKYIQELASQGSTDIRLEMTRYNGEKYYQRYTDFKLLNGTDYTISFDKVVADGTPGIDTEDFHDFNFHNGARFSTFDRDMDGRPDDLCVRRHYGGWWYSNCGTVLLNGKYCTLDEKSDQCLVFHTIDRYEPLQASRILIRRA